MCSESIQRCAAWHAWHNVAVYISMEIDCDAVASDMTASTGSAGPPEGAATSSWTATSSVESIATAPRRSAFPLNARAITPPQTTAAPATTIQVAFEDG